MTTKRNAALYTPMYKVLHNKYNDKKEDIRFIRWCLLYYK